LKLLLLSITSQNPVEVYYPFIPINYIKCRQNPVETYSMEWSLHDDDVCPPFVGMNRPRIAI